MKNNRISKAISLTSRRTLLKSAATFTAAGLAGIASAPFVSRQARAQGAPLKFWQFYAPGGQVPDQVAWFEKLVASWNETHEQKIELEYIPHGEYLNGPKLATAFASGEGPDIFLITPGDFLRYYNGGALLDLTPYIKAEARDDFIDDVIASRMVDEKIYCIPLEVQPMAMFYSVKAFEAAGLNENDIPKSWDELLEVAKKLTTPQQFGVLFETKPGYYQNFTWYPFLWQGGGDIQTPEGRSNFDSPATVQALKFWQDTINLGVAPRQSLGSSASDAIANLGSGYCAMQNVGIWAISQLDSNVNQLPYGVFKLPVPKDGKYVSIGGGWGFVANAKSRNPDAAGEFCAWALGSMEPDSIQRAAEWVTKAKLGLPSRSSVLSAGSEAFNKGVLGVFSRDIYPGTRGEPRVPPEAYKIISDAIQQTQLGGADPQQAAATASQQLDGFLASYRGAPII